MYQAPQIVHDNIVRMAEARKIGHKELCRRAGIPYTTFWRMRRGHDPQLQSLIKLAEALGVKPKSLLDGVA